MNNNLSVHGLLIHEFVGIWAKYLVKIAQVDFYYNN